MKRLLGPIFALALPAVCQAMFFSGAPVPSNAPVLTARSLAGSSPASTNDLLTWQGASAKVASNQSLTSCAITAGNSAGNFAATANGSGCDVSITSTGASNLTGSTDDVPFTLTVTGTNANGTSAGVSVAVDVYADGSTGALAVNIGTPQYPTLYTSASGGPQGSTHPTNAPYATRPPWKVAGVDYAVDMNSNVSVNTGTNVITESGLQNLHANGDLMSFYTIKGGALPTPLVQGTQYFVVNVSTNTYKISLTSGGAAITLGGSPSGVIALKSPLAMSGVAGLTVNNGAAGPTASKQITFSGNNAVLDHVDLSQDGGWTITWNTGVSGGTVSNNNWKLSTNGNLFAFISNAASAGFTFQYNRIDANPQIFTAVVNGATAAGNSTLHLSSTAIGPFGNVLVGMTVADVTTPGAISTPGGAGASRTNISVVNPTTLTMSQAAIGTGVQNGDTIAISLITATGGIPFSLSDTGTLNLKYNWIFNVDSEAYQVFGGSTLQLNMAFNLIENPMLSSSYWGDHGDIIQLYGTSGTMGTATVHFNNMIFTDPLNGDGQGMSIFASGLFGLAAANVNVNYNNLINAIVGGHTGYPIGCVQPTWVSGAINILNNYMDPTGFLFGWYNINSGCGGGNGGFTPTQTITGNQNLLTGIAQGSPGGMPNNGNLP